MRIVGTALVAVTIGIAFLLAQGGWIEAGTGQSAEVQKLPRTRHKVWPGYSLFSDFQGMKVENVDGEKLGTIKDMVIEWQTGRPEYVLVKSGGFAVGHRRCVVVPISAIALRTAKAGIAAVDITTSRWKNAPEFCRKELQGAKAPQIARFYGQAQEVPRVLMTSDQPGRLRSTGRADSTVSPSHPGTYETATDLIGMEAIDPQQSEIGRISDLLVDPEGTKSSFALLSMGGSWSTKANYAIPIQMLRSAGQKVSINATRADFSQARSFREGFLQNSTNEIYKYGR
jgi:sporulation protein YlmC with PRC-barrel domain